MLQLLQPLEIFHNLDHPTFPFKNRLAAETDLSKMSPLHQYVQALLIFTDFFVLFVINQEEKEDPKFRSKEAQLGRSPLRCKF